MANYLQHLQQTGKSDKATVADLMLVDETLAKHLYSPETMDAIPFCMIDENKRIRFKVLCILAWVRACHDDLKAKLEEVEKSISIYNVKVVIDEMLFFYTNLTRDEVEKNREIIDGDAIPENEEEQEKKPPAKSGKSGKN